MPHEVLELIFRQPVLTKAPLSLPLHHRTTPSADLIIEADGEIYGRDWARQPRILDEGPMLPCYPNHDLHRLLLVCKSWWRIVEQELYRSITIGFTSQGMNDSKASELLLRTLCDVPSLATMVQNLNLYVGTEYSRRYRSDSISYFESQLRAHADIMRLCTQVKSVRLSGYAGTTSGKKVICNGLASLTNLESLILAPGMQSLDWPGKAPLIQFDWGVAPICSFRELIRLASNWKHLRTLVILDRAIDRYASDEVQHVEEDHLDDFPCLRKLSIYNAFPPMSLLHSLLAAPQAIQVLRFAIEPWTRISEEKRCLVRETLVALAPTLQHLTLMMDLSTFRGAGRTFDISLSHGIFDDISSPRFRQLRELQTSLYLLDPKYITYFPKLQFLAYDTQEYPELPKLNRAVLEHSALRHVYLHTHYPFPNVPELPRDNYLSDLRNICDGRGILFKHGNGFQYDY